MITKEKAIMMFYSSRLSRCGT